MAHEDIVPASDFKGNIKLKTGRIITANSWFNMPFLRFRKGMIGNALRKVGLQDMGVNSKLQKLVATVNHGRWLVICPDCGGAEYAWEEKYMLCLSCYNAKVGHRFRPFVFPSERGRIEELLIVRPLPNRNWSLGETVADLERENEEHAEELLIKEVKEDVLDDSSSS